MSGYEWLIGSYYINNAMFGLATIYMELHQCQAQIPVIYSRRQITQLAEAWTGDQWLWLPSKVLVVSEGFNTNIQQEVGYTTGRSLDWRLVGCGCPPIKWLSPKGSTQLNYIVHVENLKLEINVCMFISSYRNLVVHIRIATIKNYEQMIRNL